MSRKSLKVSLFIIVALLVILFALPSIASANPTYFSTIPSGYEQSCNLCHVSPPILNQFGKDFKAAGFKFPSKTTTTTTTTTTTKPATTTTKPATTTTKPATTTVAVPVGITEREFADAIGAARASYAFYPANPSAVITRETAAEYLVNLLKLEEKASQLTTADLDKAFAKFKDGKEIGKAKVVALAIKQGLLLGYADRFDPKGVLTKSQASILAKRLTGYKSAINSKNWAESGHSEPVKSVAADGTITYMGLRNTCVACHSGEGFARNLTQAADLTDQVNPVPQVCETCHGERGKKIQAEGKTEIAAPLAVSASGIYQVTNAGKGALCMTCHQFRRNGANPQNASRQSPHGPTQSQILLGIAGFEEAGVVYPNSPHAANPNTCVTCHLAKDKDGVANHRYVLDDSMAESACGSCHKGLTSLNRGALGDYDGDGVREGIKDEVAGLQTLVKAALYAAIDNGNGGTIGSGGGSFKFLKADGTAIAASDVPDNVYKAAWNLQVVENDRSGGIHNPAYVVSLLQQTYKMLTGNVVPNARLR